MTQKKKEALEEKARAFKEYVLDQTKNLPDEQRVKVLEDTIFMLQHHVNALK